jgi:hypothetical protein
MQDGAFVGNGDEVALILRGALAEVLQVTRDMNRTHEAVRIREVLDERHPHPGHPDHVQHHRAMVGELDAGGVLLERRTRGRHQVRHHVHRPARRGPPHPFLQHQLHL